MENLDRKIALWDAINEYTAACGGDTSAATCRGNIRRMDAVVRVENIVFGSNHQPCHVCSEPGEVIPDLGIALCTKPKCWEAFRQEYNGAERTRSEQNEKAQRA